MSDNLTLEKSLIREIFSVISANKYKSSYNKPGEIKQSSISLIFRAKDYNYNKSLSQKQQPQHYDKQNPASNIIKREEIPLLVDSFNDEVEIIFLQRAFSEKDINSGQICLPGGHVDGEENDFEAALRESQEEIGLTLTPLNSFYLGKFGKSFFVRKTRTGESLYLNVHLFVLTSDFKQNLQKTEIIDLKWVSFLSNFINYSEAQLLNNKSSTLLLKPIQLPALLRSQASLALKNFDHSLNGSLNIKMDENLWGLTLFVMCHMLSLLKNSRTLNLAEKDRETHSKISRLLLHASRFEMQFKNNYTMPMVLESLTKYYVKKARYRQYVQERTEMGFRQLLTYGLLLAVPICMAYSLVHLK